MGLWDDGKTGRRGDGEARRRPEKEMTGRQRWRGYVDTWHGTDSPNGTACRRREIDVPEKAGKERDKTIFRMRRRDKYPPRPRGVETLLVLHRMRRRKHLRQFTVHKI